MLIYEFTLKIWVAKIQYSKSSVVLQNEMRKMREPILKAGMNSIDEDQHVKRHIDI